VSSFESFDEIVEANHEAGLSILNGSPDGYKAMYSKRDDITRLINQNTTLRSNYIKTGIRSQYA